jgi:hypothetical protein
MLILSHQTPLRDKLLNGFNYNFTHKIISVVRFYFIPVRDPHWKIKNKNILMNNLNKLTKVELINKIDQLKNENLDIKVKNSNANKINDDKINSTTKINSANKINNDKIDSTTKINDDNTSLYIIFSKIKTLILSLTIKGIFTQIFKNYKTVRLILKAANYIIVLIFGMSIFDAFGLGFIAKFLGEFKYIFGAVVAYLTESTFYTYLMQIFNINEEKESIRSNYKKPVEIDWKAEYEKAERQREIEKWKEKYAQDKEGGGVNKKTILIALLLLGASIGTWYYGKEALDIISPLYNISNLIKNILRGGNEDNDDDDNNSPEKGNIGLDPSNRSESPDMMVYASDMIHPKLNEHLPPVAPPAPTLPTDLPAHTEQGPPNSLLDQIKRGKSLKKSVTNERQQIFNVGKEVASSSKSTLVAKLSNKLDEIRNKVSGDDEEIIEDLGGWDNNSETTPTQSPKLDKGKGKEKFLDAISRDDEKIIPPSKIANVLKPIMERFPNLSQETLEKLSTPEGLKNRKEIIASLSEDELKTNMSLKEISSMSKEEVIKMDKLIQSTLNLDSEKVVEILNKELPDYNFDVNSYKELFIKGTEEEINSGKTVEERDRIRKEILEADLLELQKTGGSSDIRKIKNAIRENYTHNSLINSIKNKSSLSSIENETDEQPSKPKIDWTASFSKAKSNVSDADLVAGKSKITEPFSYLITEDEQKERGIDNIMKLPIITNESDITPSNNSMDLQPELSRLDKLVNKAKNLQTLEDLNMEDKVLLEYECSIVKPDELINKFKDLPDYAEDSYVDKLITVNIDETIKNMIAECDGKAGKQYIIEKLLLENPNHKDKILSVVSKTFNEQLNYWENKFSAKDFSRIQKVLLKEDLQELQELGENKTMDQLRTVATVNKSHINLLKEIKTKASQTSLNKKESSFDTSHLEDTMNLFE